MVSLFFVDFTGSGCQCAVDYCSDRNNVCQNGGLCENTEDGGFHCQCPAGRKQYNSNILRVSLTMTRR